MVTENKIISARGAMAEKETVFPETGQFPTIVCQPSLLEPDNTGVRKRFTVNIYHHGHTGCDGNVFIGEDRMVNTSPAEREVLLCHFFLTGLRKSMNMS